MIRGPSAVMTNPTPGAIMSAPASTPMRITSAASYSTLGVGTYQYTTTCGILDRPQSGDSVCGLGPDAYPVIVSSHAAARRHYGPRTLLWRTPHSMRGGSQSVAAPTTAASAGADYGADCYRRRLACYGDACSKPPYAPIADNSVVPLEALRTVPVSTADHITFAGASPDPFVTEPPVVVRPGIGWARVIADATHTSAQPICGRYPAWLVPRSTRDMQELPVMPS